ncbi:MAG TPA: hypothetical protein VIH25_05915 [Steroidobacteraceae bacterium]
MDGLNLKLRIVAAVLLIFQSASAWGVCSPIVIDLGKDGIQLGEAGVGVRFDVNNDGLFDHLQWVRPGGDEAFLVLDRNANGVVDNGGELFGIGTPMFFEGGKASNGFVGLAQYDSLPLGGNDDGYITRDDAIWPHLQLWLDINADGISTANEMLTPDDVGVTSFETIPKVRRRSDAAGNLLPFWAWAMTDTRPKRTLMVDVFFVEL